jgi:membrane protein YqaA with SNARE-associated domain
MAKTKRENYLKRYGKLLRYLGVFLLIGVIAALMQPIILKVIINSPDLKSTYDFIKGELDKTSIFWLFIVAFISGLFFISLPIDILFLYYIISGGDPLLSFIAVWSGIIISHTLDFWFGHLFRDYTYKHVIKEHSQQFGKKLSKWGSSILFFGNFIPFFPMETFVVFIGTTKYKFSKYLIYQGLGKFLKLALIILFVKFFVDQQVLLTFNFFDVIRSMMEYLLNVI